MNYFTTLNIESGKPRVEGAKQLLMGQLAIARRQGVKVIKLIHGYGSSGKGGVLRTELRKMLSGMREVKTIEGEDFGIFDAATRDLIAKYPDLRRDSDLNKSNPGITMIVLL
jgi:hypothetical protein